MQYCTVVDQDLQDPDRDPSEQNCLADHQDLRDTDRDRIVRSCSDVAHMHSRWQRVILLMYDKWSADENIMLRWQLIAKLMNAKMDVYDPQDMGSRWERLGFLMRDSKS